MNLFDMICVILNKEEINYEYSCFIKGISKNDKVKKLFISENQKEFLHKKQIHKKFINMCITIPVK